MALAGKKARVRRGTFKGNQMTHKTLAIMVIRSVNTVIEKANFSRRMESC